jgi:hypothetical protein
LTETIGRMTDSWTPTKKITDTIATISPHVHPHLELELFKDYYQSRSEVLVLSQDGWDRRFRSWCARAERRWLEEHNSTDVKYDEVTGMPVNPKPMRFKEGK